MKSPVNPLEKRGTGEETPSENYVLRLYVTGATPRSIKATKNIKEICEKYLDGRYQLEVVDLYQQPLLAVSAGIIAAPTLIKQLPLPLRKFIGDLSDTKRVLLGFELVEEAEDHEGSADVTE
jgi:circadian clock protein KaiB